MKTAVWFQGGGPLGSFGCGAWPRIAQWLRARGDRLVPIGGSSIGALNAARLRPCLGHGDDGAVALDHFWRHGIAAPSWPFLGWNWGTSPQARRHRGWNGCLTGLLVGNGLYRPSWPAWTPWGVAYRWQQPLFDRAPLARLIEREVPAYRSGSVDDVLLAVTTCDVGNGTLRLHDSDHGEIGAAHLLASTAIPVLFGPVELGGTWHWDGEIVRDSPLPAFLEATRRSGRVTRGEPLRLITVELLPRPAAALPGSGPEMLYRVLNLAQADRLAESGGPDEHIRIMRPPGEEDGVSSLFDHSPQRVDALIAEGDAAAALALPAV